MCMCLCTWNLCCLNSYACKRICKHLGPPRVRHAECPLLLTYLWYKLWGDVTQRFQHGCGLSIEQRHAIGHLICHFKLSILYFILEQNKQVYMPTHSALLVLIFHVVLHLRATCESITCPHKYRHLFLEQHTKPETTHLKVVHFAWTAHIFLVSWWHNEVYCSVTPLSASWEDWFFFFLVDVQKNNLTDWHSHRGILPPPLPPQLASFAWWLHWHLMPDDFTGILCLMTSLASYARWLHWKLMPDDFIGILCLMTSLATYAWWLHQHLCLMISLASYAWWLHFSQQDQQSGFSEAFTPVLFQGPASPHWPSSCGSVCACSSWSRSVWLGWSSEQEAVITHHAAVLQN